MLSFFLQKAVLNDPDALYRVVADHVTLCESACEYGVGCCAPFYSLPHWSPDPHLLTCQSSEISLHFISMKMIYFITKGGLYCLCG